MPLLFFKPLNIVTDSQYAERVILQIAPLNLFQDDSELILLFGQLQWSMYKTHIRTYTGLPELLEQCNDEKWTSATHIKEGYHWTNERIKYRSDPGKRKAQHFLHWNMVVSNSPPKKTKTLKWKIEFKIGNNIQYQWKIEEDSPIHNQKTHSF